MAGTARCRSCGAPIRFLTIELTGRAMPVDPNPDELGNVAAQKRGYRWSDAYVISKSRPLLPGWVLFMPHRKTCAATSGPSRPRPSAPPPVADPLF